MHPSIHAERRPDAVAAIFEPSGEVRTYGDIDAASARIAHFLRAQGLREGGVIALLLENEPAYFDLAWAAQRIGLYFVCVPTRLTAGEVAHILEDSGASQLFASPSLCDLARAGASGLPGVKVWATGPNGAGVEECDPHIADMPATRPDNETAGSDMLYSSGTTGRPKGVKLPLSGGPIETANRQTELGRSLYGMDEHSVFLSPAPLYHAAPLRWCMTFTRIGATLVVMEKFEPEDYLRQVEKHKITHTQLVPTMFVKMLKLPEDVRKKYDVSSIKFAIHAAAPCPVPVKEQMIAWWGPVIDEYYAGSEGNGMTWVKSPDWLTHKGTVGRPVMGVLHICNEEGDEVPVGEEGQVYFGGTTPPNYHNAPEKNKAALNPKHPDWSSLDNVGKVDADGFLYLTDRKAFMIISGGVNIYPQECENILITHPKVADCAVIGVPDEDFGEAVKAVVQPMPGIAPSEELAAELMAHCLANLSKIKCPKSIDFDPELPRHPTGKLYKRLIRDRYWGNKDSRIV